MPIHRKRSMPLPRISSMPLHRISSMPPHPIWSMPLHRISSKPLHRIWSMPLHRISSTLRCRISSTLPDRISSTLRWYCLAGGVMGIFVCGVRWWGGSDVVAGLGFLLFVQCGCVVRFLSACSAYTSFRQRHRVIAAFKAHRASSVGFSSFPYTLPLRVCLCCCFLPSSASPGMAVLVFPPFVCIVCIFRHGC
jgi:hypothetical protein